MTAMQALFDKLEGAAICCRCNVQTRCTLFSMPKKAHIQKAARTCSISIVTCAAMFVATMLPHRCSLKSRETETGLYSDSVILLGAVVRKTAQVVRGKHNRLHLSGETLETVLNKALKTVLNKGLSDSVLTWLS